MSLTKKYWNIRRKILRAFVPEFIWPKESVIDGVSFKIRNTPYSYGTKQALKNGNYEVSERNLLQGQIRAGDVVIEMGGSIGVLTAILANKVGDNGVVISLEASEKITSYSKTWLEKKENTRVLTGFGFPVFLLRNKISIHSFDEEGGSLGGTLSFKIDEQASVTNEQDASVFDINRIMQEFNIAPTVLVVDVEGSERIITDNKPAYPVSVRLILMEMHAHMYGNDTRDDIIQNIVDEGFRIVNDKHGVYLFERA